MQLLFRPFGQRPQLADWESRPFTPGSLAGPGPADRRDSYEREVGREAPGEPEPLGLYRRLADAVLGYRVFPPALLSGVLRRQPVELGDTVGILFHAPLGLELFFAARVIDCFDGPDAGRFRSGFTYRTLAGHPELGEETFAVEKELATGAIRVSLRSWSRPATLLTRCGAPLLRWLQIYASHAALDNLEALARPPAAATAATRSL